MVVPVAAVAAEKITTWALLLIGGRFAIKPLAQVAAKNLRYVKAHINSVKKPPLTGTPQNPNGVITKAGNLSKAKNITPVGTPGWSGDFLKAALNPKAANLVTQIRLYGTKKAATQLAGMGISIAALEATIDDNAEYIDPRIPRPEDRQALIDGRKPSAPTSQQEFAERTRAGYREQHQREVDKQQLDPNEQAPKRFIPTEFRQRVAENVPWDYRRKAPGISAGYPDLTRSTPEGEKIYQDRMRQKMQNWYGRLTAEKEAIAAADPSSPKFTSAELEPYKKVAESGFGQKLFGLRRSAPEIERDVTYTDLKMQGRDEEADQYWSDWNAANKAKKDAALGEGKSLTEYTRDDPTRETSFAEDIVKKVNKALPQKKKGGGRVSSRPKSYRTAKVMKKYAKGGSVRKPKRIK
jgi:hypothetical protein